MTGFPEQWMKNDDTFQAVNVQGTANMIDTALNAKIELHSHQHYRCFFRH